MCRGGKDGKTIRCLVKKHQVAQANLRKQIKYRADKEQITVEEWKNANPDEVLKLTARVLPNTSKVSFQPISAGRKLAEDIPANLSEHMKISKDHIDTRLSEIECLALSGYTGFAAGCANLALMTGEIPPERLYDEAPPWRETDNGPTDFSTKEDMIDYMETMDNVLAERAEEQRVLYRGMPIYDALQGELEKLTGKDIEVEDTKELLEALGKYYEPGKVFDFPTYLSTTHSANYAADRTHNSSGTRISYYDKPEVRGIVLEMKTNAGLDVTGVARHHAREREVVLPRDTRFRVESVTLRPESYDTVSGYDKHKHPDKLVAENFTNLAVVVQMVEVGKDGNEITHQEPHEPSPLNF